MVEQLRVVIVPSGVPAFCSARLLPPLLALALAPEDRIVTVAVPLASAEARARTTCNADTFADQPPTAVVLVTAVPPESGVIARE